MTIEIKLDDKVVFNKTTFNSYDDTIEELINAINLLAKERNKLLTSWKKNYPNDEIPIQLCKILIN